jgi:hypothetical protein
VNPTAIRTVANAMNRILPEPDRFCIVSSLPLCGKRIASPEPTSAQVEPHWGGIVQDDSTPMKHAQYAS